MRAGHWVLILTLGLAPPTLYAGVVVASVALGFWKAYENPPKVRLVFVDRAAPSGTAGAPSAPRTIETPP